MKKAMNLKSKTAHLYLSHFCKKFYTINISFSYSIPILENTCINLFYQKTDKFLLLCFSPVNRVSHIFSSRGSDQIDSFTVIWKSQAHYETSLTINQCRSSSGFELETTKHSKVKVELQYNHFYS